MYVSRLFSIFPNRLDVEWIEKKGTGIEIESNGDVKYRGWANKEDEEYAIENIKCGVCYKKLAKEESENSCAEMSFCDGCNYWFCNEHFTNEEDHKYYGDDGYFNCIVCDLSVQHEYKQQKLYKKRKQKEKKKQYY